MKQTVFVLWVVFFGCWFSLAQAGPEFWASQETETPTPEPLVPYEENYQSTVPSPTPVTAPAIGWVTSTPTPQPGLSPKDPTLAAVMSVFVPGSGEVYADEPLKGIAFATLFGVSLWQTIDNLTLHRDSSDDLVAKDENAGNLFGIATLALYGFDIEDSMASAASYNRRHYLTLGLGLSPRPSAQLAYYF